MFSARPVAQVLRFMLWLWSLLKLNQKQKYCKLTAVALDWRFQLPRSLGWELPFLRDFGTELLLRTLWLPEWGLQTQGAVRLRSSISFGSLAECLGSLIVEVRSLDPYACWTKVFNSLWFVRVRAPFLCGLSVWGLRLVSRVGCRCEYFSHICAVWLSPQQRYYDLNLSCPLANSCFRCLPQPEALFLEVLETLRGGL